MTFQERNGTCGMKQKRSGWNLAEKSGTDRDLKWDEICSVFWIGMEHFDYSKRNEIELTTLYRHLHAITCCLELFDTWLHFDDVIWSDTCVLMFFQAYYSRIFVVLLSNVLLNNWFSSACTTEPLSLCYGCKKIFDTYNTLPIKYLLWL